MTCPLCIIPSREPLLYSDDICYISNTIKDKGHKLRVMVTLNRHTDTPTTLEFTHSLDRLHKYMENNSPTETFYLVFGTHASVPAHFHIIGCDDNLTTEESALMFDSDYVRCLIYGNKRRILIGIPAHNEEAHISEVITKAKKYGTVLVLNNGSTDKTEEISLRSGALVCSYKWSGYGRAIQEIFKYAKTNNYDILITLDSDGQHNPDEIPPFLTSLSTSDIVVGNRFIKNNTTPFHRKMIISGLNIIYGVGDSQCGFRVYNKQAISKLSLIEDNMGVSLEILTKARELSLRMSEVPCTITYLKEKPIRSLLQQGMSLIETLFWGTVWARPYTILGIPAFLLFLTSLFFGSWSLIHYTQTKSLVPSLALICGISFISSLALLSITFIITIQRRLIKEVTKK